MQIPALSDSAGTFLSLPGSLSSAGGRGSASERPDLIANFRLFSRYFCINSVEKSYRKAFINYLRKSMAKIGENRRKSAKIGGVRVLAV